jgi:hypothetical protein
MPTCAITRSRDEALRLQRRDGIHQPIERQSGADGGEEQGLFLRSLFVQDPQRIEHLGIGPEVGQRLGLDDLLVRDRPSDAGEKRRLVEASEGIDHHHLRAQQRAKATAKKTAPAPVLMTTSGRSSKWPLPTETGFALRRPASCPEHRALPGRLPRG